MARIEFWPLCTACGHVLKYERVYFEIHDMTAVDACKAPVKLYSSDLVPSRCPYCNEVFDGVSISDLPFDPRYDRDKAMRWSNGKFGRRYRSKTKRGCV